MKRCRWCGRYVHRDTQPMIGLDYYGRPIAQTLCPAHQDDWRELAALNVMRGPHR